MATAPIITPANDRTYQVTIMDYYDEQDSELNGMFDFLSDDKDDSGSDSSPGIFDSIVSEASSIGKDLYSDVKGQLTNKVKAEVADGKKKLADALDFEAKAKAAAQQKLDAELERASRNVVLSIIDLFTEDEIKTLRAQGKIVLDKSGRAVRDTKTGEILTLAEYKAMVAKRAQDNKQLAGLLAGILGTYRDDPAKRALIDMQYQDRIAKAATTKEKTALIAAHNKLKEWLVANPSPNSGARTQEQNERLKNWGEFLLAAQVQAINTFRSNPRAYADYRNALNAKIQAAETAGNAGEVNRLKRQAYIFDGAVKSTQKAEAYLAAKRKEFSDAIAGNQRIASTAATATGQGSGGSGGALLAAALGIGLLLLG